MKKILTGEKELIAKEHKKHLFEISFETFKETSLMSQSKGGGCHEAILNEGKQRHKSDVCQITQEASYGVATADGSIDFYTRCL